MSVVKIGPFEYPEYRLARPINGTISKLALVINGASDIIEYNISVSASGTIENVYIETGTVTASGDIRVAIQRHDDVANGPETHGNGSDVVFATQTVGTGLVIHQFGPLTDDGTASGTKMTVSQGDVLSIMIRRGTGTSFNGEFLYINSAAAAAETQDQVPSITPNLYRSTDGGSNWTFFQGGVNASIEYDDNTFVKQDAAVVEFFINPSTTSIGLNTTPDEIGNRFIPETTIEVAGFVTYGDNGEANCKIYDASDTVLVERKTGTHGGDSTDSQRRKHYFASNVVLTGGQVYRITLSYLNASAGDGIAGVDVGDNLRLEAFPGGKEFYRTERTDAGSWTDVDDQRFLLNLIVTGIDVTPTINNFTRGFPVQQIGSGINASVPRIF